MNAAHCSPILTAAQMRAADRATMTHEPIASIDLMERAAHACTDWFTAQAFDESTQYHIVCGTGNNGGDGFAIARLLHARGRRVTVYCVQPDDAAMSADAAINLNRLKQTDCPIHLVSSNEDIQAIAPLSAQDICIDALFGTGCTRRVTGLSAQMMVWLNQHAPRIVAIDLPSGLLADAHTPNDWPVVHATHTLSFECAKPALLWPENGERVGAWRLLPIGFHAPSIAALPTEQFLLTRAWARAHIQARPKFAHKGTFGHALLIAGAYGTVGAALLAARACLRSGAGLLTVHSPQCAYVPLQTALPEAMVHSDAHAQVWSEPVRVEKYNALAIGCGMGQADETRAALRAQLHALSKIHPAPALVLDADALNLLAHNADLWRLLPPNTILTPHPKEFERLAAHASLDLSNDAQRLNAALTLAQQYQVIVVLKGAHTCVALPDGCRFYNTTGNPGMAKGGSGDALTGVILGLLAQGYAPATAACLGVYLHGAAGDAAAQEYGQRAMLPSDLIACLAVPI